MSDSNKQSEPQDASRVPSGDLVSTISARPTPNACILAVAGSGKTRTLVHLIALDLVGGIPPTTVVAFTFTERAAEELAARVQAFLVNNYRQVTPVGMFIGTIHAWCLQYLVQQERFRNHEPIDELHLESLASRLYDYLGLGTAYGRRFPHAIELFAKDLDVLYNEHTSPDACAKHRAAEALRKMIQILDGNRLLPFGAMISEAINHLLANGPVPGLRRLYVDEYQDVNPAQVQLVKAMAGPESSIVAVGDDLQAIYQWRGSDVRRILQFRDEFPGSTVYRIRSNHRARPPGLVIVANAVAALVSVRDPEKEMIPARPASQVPVLHWLSLDNEQAQAEAIVRIVKRFRQNGVPLGRIAVLLRSVIGSGRPIVEELSRARVPVDCPILGRSGGFITEFLLPVFDWLRLQHPEAKNEVEQLEAERLVKALWEQVMPWLPNDETAADRFWDGLAAWVQDIERGASSAYDVRGKLYDFLDRCGIRIRPDDSALMAGVGIASQIIRSVEEVQRRRLSGQSRRTPHGVMNEVYFALLRSHVKFGESIPAEISEDRLLVTTVHQAKGLEWPIVILPVLDQGRFPVPERPHGTSFPDGVAGRYGTTIDDELRLFYVAVTRARERLFLLDTSASSPNRRSFFLRALEERGVIASTVLASVDNGVWYISPEDLRPADVAPLNIGLSDLLIFIDCPYQFALRRRAGIQPSIGEELGYGKGVHDVIRRRFEARAPWSGHEVNTQVTKHTHLPYLSEEAEAISRRSIAQRISKLQEIGAFQENVEAEVVVQVELPGGVVHGIIDCIYTDEQGNILLRDWKTNLHPGFMSRYERQLQFYAYALSLQGKRVTRAELIDVAASAEEGRLVAKTVDVGDQVILGLVSEFNRSMDALTKHQYPARPSATVCDSCDMYQLCAVRADRE